MVTIKNTYEKRRFVQIKTIRAKILFGFTAVLLVIIVQGIYYIF